MPDEPVVVVGAGPAGLTAAYWLAGRGMRSVVLEKADQVGGISRTATYRGYRFDIGGHRFFTKVPEVEALWHEILGDDFIEVSRLSRIYYGGKFYHYPLDLWNTLGNLGPWESLKILLSYARSQLRTPYPDPDNLKEWVTNRFGERLFETFFRTYTEKVWGIPCEQIRADWAAQRIKGLSLKEAVLNALFNSSDETSLIHQFHYPVHGPGMMWERCAGAVESRGSEVRLRHEVVRLERDGGRITAAVVRHDGGSYRLTGDHFINSMPLATLVQRLDPPPPPHILEAARGLAYRDFLIVALILDRKALFPDNWIYVHSPHVRVGRIQNFKNWSAAMVPDPDTTCLGMEYFCNEGEDLWQMPDEALIRLATDELAAIGLGRPEELIDGTVIRQPKAYPVYDSSYKEHVATIRDYLAGISNLQTVGRAGLHRYNNQDHSMLTAMMAARNVVGERHDVWNVNVERSYHEEFMTEERRLERRAVGVG